MLLRPAVSISTAAGLSLRPTVSRPVVLIFPISAVVRLNVPAFPSPIPTLRVVLDGVSVTSPVPGTMLPAIATSAAVMVIAVLLVVMLVPACVMLKSPAALPSESADRVPVPVPLWATELLP